VIEIEETQWPLVTFTFSGKVTLAEMGEYLAACERYIQLDEQYIGLVLVRDFRPLDGAAIRLQANWVKEHEAWLRRKSLGVALVLPSLWMVGLLRAILWIQPMPQPYLVCRSVAEATPWLRERLRAAGIDSTHRKVRGAA
jgi:hypothetical protein